MSLEDELVCLGFERYWVKQALIITGGHKDYSIEWLLSDEFKNAQREFNQMRNHNAHQAQFSQNGRFAQFVPQQPQQQPQQMQQFQQRQPQQQQFQQRQPQQQQFQQRQQQQQKQRQWPQPPTHSAADSHASVLPPQPLVNLDVSFDEPKLGSAKLDSVEIEYEPPSHMSALDNDQVGVPIRKLQKLKSRAKLMNNNSSNKRNKQGNGKKRVSVQVGGVLVDVDDIDLTDTESTDSSSFEAQMSLMSDLASDGLVTSGNASRAASAPNGANGAYGANSGYGANGGNGGNGGNGVNIKSFSMQKQGNQGNNNVVVDVPSKHKLSPVNSNNNGAGGNGHIPRESYANALDDIWHKFLPNNPTSPNLRRLATASGSVDNDWICGECGKVLPLDAEKCTVCGTAKPLANDWVCHTCTFVNHDSDSLCAMCLFPRPKDVRSHLASVVAGVTPPDGNNNPLLESSDGNDSFLGSGGASANNSVAAAGADNVGKRVEFDLNNVSTWVCSFCEYHNTDEVLSCRMCGTKRGGKSQDLVFDDDGMGPKFGDTPMGLEDEESSTESSSRRMMQRMKSRIGKLGMLEEDDEDSKEPDQVSIPHMDEALGVSDEAPRASNLSKIPFVPKKGQNVQNVQNNANNASSGNVATGPPPSYEFLQMSQPPLNQQSSQPITFTLKVGEEIEVFSQSKQAWVSGNIQEIRANGLMCVMYAKHLKWLRKDSKQIRPKKTLIREAVVKQSSANNSINLADSGDNEAGAVASQDTGHAIASDFIPSAPPLSVTDSIHSLAAEEDNMNGPRAGKVEVDKLEFGGQPPPPAGPPPQQPPPPSGRPPANAAAAAKGMSFAAAQQYAASMTPGGPGGGDPPPDQPQPPPPANPPPPQGKLPPPPQRMLSPRAQRREDAANTEAQDDEFDYDVTFTTSVLGMELVSDNQSYNCEVSKCLSKIAQKYVDPGSLIVAINDEWCGGLKYKVIRERIKAGAKNPPLKIKFRTKLKAPVKKKKKKKKYMEPGYLKIKVVAATELAAVANIAEVDMVGVKLETRRVEKNHHPQWMEMLTFKNYRPGTIPKATITVMEQGLLQKNNNKIAKKMAQMAQKAGIDQKPKIVGTAEFDLPKTFNKLDRLTLELLNPKGKLAGLVIVNTIVLNRMNSVAHLNRY